MSSSSPCETLRLDASMSQGLTFYSLRNLQCQHHFSCCRFITLSPVPIQLFVFNSSEMFRQLPTQEGDLTCKMPFLTFLFGSHTHYSSRRALKLTTTALIAAWAWV